MHVCVCVCVHTVYVYLYIRTVCVLNVYNLQWTGNNSSQLTSISKNNAFMAKIIYFQILPVEYGACADICVMIIGGIVTRIL